MEGKELKPLDAKEVNAIIAELTDMKFGNKDVMSYQDIVKQVKLTQLIVTNIMQEDTHYGVIPGTPKPTLYKAGAEKLNFAFRLRAEYSFITKVETSELISFTVCCKLYHINTGILWV